MDVEQTDLEDQESVLRALDLPAIAPEIDRTASAIARRAGLSSDKVADILCELEGRRPRIVRPVRGRGTVFWFRTPFAPPNGCA